MTTRGPDDRRAVGRPLRSLARLPPRDQAGAAMVLLLAVLVELGVRTVPLSRLARWARTELRLANTPTLPPLGVEEPKPPLEPAERRWVRNVYRVMRHWPFGKGSCLRQSLLLGYLLRRRSPALRLGVGRHDGTVLAHAWLEVSGVSIGDDQRLLPLLGRAGLR